MSWKHIVLAMVLAPLFCSPVAAACITGTPCASLKPLFIRPPAPAPVTPSANPSSNQNAYPSAYPSTSRSAYPTGYPAAYPSGGFGGGS